MIEKVEKVENTENREMIEHIQRRKKTIKENICEKIKKIEENT